MNRTIGVAIIFLLCTRSWGEGVPCWIRCHHPPKIRSADQVSKALRHKPNKPLTLLARSTGFLTTYAGKLLGIQGWKDFHLHATVIGEVIQAVGSDDGLYTIDLEIKQLTVGTQQVRFCRPSFIRIEVFPLVRCGASLPAHKGEELRVQGSLLWDGDGFLEIHPRHANQISRMANSGLRESNSRLGRDPTSHSLQAGGKSVESSPEHQGLCRYSQIHQY